MILVTVAFVAALGAAACVALAGGAGDAPLPQGPDTTPERANRTVVTTLAGVALGLLAPVMLFAGVNAATAGDLLCPVDAACSTPRAPAGLAVAASGLVGTVALVVAGRRRRWRPGPMAAVVGLALLVLVAGLVLASTYRIDVPRP